MPRTASGQVGFDASAGFASNGHGEHSAGGYSLTAVLVWALHCVPVSSFFKMTGPYSPLWLFWLAPIVGAVLVGMVYRWFESEE